MLNLSKGDPNYPVVKTRAVALIAGIKYALAR